MDCCGPKTPLIVCAVVATLGIGSVITGHVFKSMSRPSGPLGRYYEVPLCKDNSAAFQSSMYNVYPGVRPGESTCTMAQHSLEPQKIALEKMDGFRSDATYTSSVLISSKAYALVSFSITDSRGTKLAPTGTMELGPDYNFPWRSKNFGSGEATGTPQRRLAEKAVDGAAADEAVAGEKAAGGGHGWHEWGEASVVGDGEVDGEVWDSFAEVNDRSAAKEEWADGWADGAGDEWAHEALQAEAEAADEAVFNRRRGGFSSSRSSFGSSRSYSSYSRSTSWGASRSSSYSSSRSSYSSSRSSTYSRAYSDSRRRFSSSGFGTRYSSGSFYASRGTAGYGYHPYSMVSPYALHPYPLYSPYYFSPLGVYPIGGYPLYIGLGYHYHVSYMYSAFAYGAMLSAVRPMHYGYGSGGGYRSSQVRLSQAQDAYNMDISFKTPAADDGWPYFLVVHNTTVFTINTQPAPTAIYVSFLTADGASYGSWASVLMGVGYPLTILSLIICCCCVYSSGSTFFEAEEEWVGDDHPQPRWNSPWNKGGVQMR